MSQLEFPFAKPPAPGERIDVSGIQWIRQSLPFVLDHVNCWYLPGDNTSALIDTGVNMPESKQFLQSHVDSLGSPDKLIVTHFHPDHSGLAGWFESQNIPVHTSQIEIDVVRTLWEIADEEYGEFYASWYQRNGIVGDAITQARQHGNRYKKLVYKPPVDSHYLSAGDVVDLGDRRFTVMIGRGHAPDMLMFYNADSNLLVSADQVLPTISPNVSLMPNTPDDDPLNSFIETLNELKKLPDNTLVLPSHGLPFYGLHHRIDDLLAHHELRCSQILEACVEPRSASDLFGVLFNRDLDAQQLSFALGESLAHARHLCNQGALIELDNDDIVQFQTSRS